MFVIGEVNSDVPSRCGTNAGKKKSVAPNRIRAHATPIS